MLREVLISPLKNANAAPPHFVPCCCSAWCVPAWAQDFNVLAFGARADSTSINTQAIQAAIDACSAKGGGNVMVPRVIFFREQMSDLSRE